MLEYLDLMLKIKVLNIFKVVKALKTIKILNIFKRTKAINISRQATLVGS